MEEIRVDKTIYSEKAKETMRRAQKKYVASHREKLVQNQLNYVARMKEQDLDAWRAKRAEYTRRYREKQKLKKAELNSNVIE